MSRRTRRRLRRQWKPLLVAAATTALILRWAWTTHPWATLTAHLIAAAAAVAYLRVRGAWRMRDGQRTWLYRHYMTNGAPLYYGITNSYTDRCGQHADGSWWWPYVDPARSTAQQWPNRPAALAAERAAIAADTPIGNTEHNHRWFAQQPARVQMQAAVGWAPRPTPQPAWPARRGWSTRRTA